MAIIRAYPDGCKEVGGISNYLPIAFAARHDTNTDIQKEIINNNKKDAKVFVSLVAQEKEGYNNKTNIKLSKE